MGIVPGVTRHRLASETERNRMMIRRLLQAMGYATAALTITACANSGGLSSAPPGLPQNSTHRPRTMATSGYTFYTVDYPYEEPNRITGIADNREVVGVYGPVGSQGAYSSYTSEYTSSQPYAQFQNNDYPNAQSTYMNSIVAPSVSSGVPSEAGYVIDPGDLKGTWGVVNNAGLWSLSRRHRGEANCHMMELFGINSSEDAVGFYWYDQSTKAEQCKKYDQYATKLLPGSKFHDYSRVQGDYPVASGINEYGWVVGSTDDTGTGPSQGWTTKKGLSFNYWNFNDNSKLSTQMLGVNAVGTIVGTYEDGSGNWHGFAVTNLFAPSNSSWQTIDDPDGNGTSTVISGIDDSNDLCGWYTGTDGVVHGFVAIHQ